MQTVNWLFLYNIDYIINIKFNIKSGYAFEMYHIYFQSQNYLNEVDNLKQVKKATIMEQKI